MPADACQELITADDFAAFTQRPAAVVKFGMPWCRPCNEWDKNDVPVLIREFGERVSFAKVDLTDGANSGTEASRAMKTTVDIGAVPHVAVFAGGQKIADFRGKCAEDVRALLTTIAAPAVTEEGERRIVVEVTGP